MKVFTKEIHKICPYLEGPGHQKIDIASGYCIDCHHRVNFIVNENIIECDYEDIHSENVSQIENENKISGIWEHEYVRTLGILDHCHEVIQLYNQIRVHKPINQPMLDTAKNLVDFPDTVILFQNQFNKELMDLYLILDKHFENNVELKNARLNRFKEKEKKNEI